MSGDLPTGWVESTLVEVIVALESGSRPRGGVRGIAEGIPSIGGEHLNYNGGFNFNSVKYVPHQFAASMNRGQIQINDILVVKDGATTGKTAFVDSTFPFKQAVVNEHVFICRPTTQIIPEFLFRFLSSKDGQERILENFKGSAQGGINQTFAANTEIPLAPLSEQKRIMAKVEKLLAKVDASRTRLEKIPILLKRFRQSVLAAACSGRLTADWREKHLDVEPAAELFAKLKVDRQRRYAAECKEADTVGRRQPKNPDTNKRSRNLVNELPDLPETWGYYRLEELCHLITDGTHKTPIYQDKGIPFLSVKNVRPFLIRDADIKFISEQEHKFINTRCNPKRGDILYTKVGATFGYAAINNLDYDFSIFVSLALLKPVVPYFSSKYAELAMNSEIVFQQARERISGIGTPDLHLVEIRDFRAPLPPLPEQAEIVHRVEELFALADRLEARVGKAGGQVDKLTQSILAKAFRGELVPQDPNDEPAEKLLARIRSATGSVASKDGKAPVAAGARRQRRCGKANSTNE